MAMNAKEKARLLGLLFGIYTVVSLGIVLVVGIIYTVIFAVVASAEPGKGSSPPPDFLVPLIVVVFAIAFVVAFLFAIPEIVAAYALRRDKPYARIWTIVASAIACMSFPLGTALGVFGLVFTFSDEGRAYFEELEVRGRRLKAQGDLLSPPQPNSWQ